ncbi:HlyD family type I secretion periplasmic adaptor subunit [Roseovarius sp. MMSF_3281]|uniref:HlyD family type I secretion periplasmic adaptor subunit n=1 Tax=Roseovarius sp. MMSF_3281 TaxID=3046694 RepID=UPI00273EEF47|nr:HlyD family type I secretion periplasmic adaptor subunit [Roseovarius sp. MMSF_3281]
MRQLAKPAAPEWFDEVPRSIVRHTFLGILVIVLALGGFGAWAFRAPLAAAVITQGSFVATGNNQIVQHLEGGMIREILVGEGDFVKAGQPIMHLDETAAEAKLRELFLRRARLEILTARLLAEYRGAETFDIPRFLDGEQDDPAVQQILRNQTLNFEAARTKLNKDISVLERNIDALDSRLDGYSAQLSSLITQIALLDEDIEAQSILFEKGLSPKTRINSLRRAKADGTGQIGRLKAQLTETAAMRAKYQGEIEQARIAHQQAALDELQSAEAELDSVRENYRKAADVYRRSSINAPVSGTVVRMNYNTPGGVIESGKPIAEILPTSVPLIIETQVPRVDIDSVKLGQEATVRLTSLNQRTTPVLFGTVYYISADALPDDSELIPQEVYLARVQLPASELSRVPGFTPTPGMPAEVMIQTAERTFFEYLSKPIVDSMQRAFREQ